MRTENTPETFAAELRMPSRAELDRIRRDARRMSDEEVARLLRSAGRGILRLGRALGRPLALAMGGPGSTADRREPMPSRLPLLAVAGALALASQARADDAEPADAYLAITGLASEGRAAADEPCPLDARVVALGGGGTAVVYYEHDPEGGDALRVVTTVAAGPDGSAAPARFVSRLAPGQTAEVSVAGAPGAGPATLELVHDGGRLVVRPAPAGPQG